MAKRKGINLSALDTTADTKPLAPPVASRVGAVNALSDALGRGVTIRKINADQINDQTGAEDRLHPVADADKRLMESLKQDGQKVPVILRPTPDKPGRFDVVAGRRRVRALRALGQPIEAIVRDHAESELLAAQVIENAHRLDLTFFERALLATHLQESGFDRQRIADTLATDRTNAARLLLVGGALDRETARALGACPGAGRDPWVALVKQLDEPGARGRLAAALENIAAAPSEARFSMAQTAIAPPVAKKPPAPPSRALRIDGETFGAVKETARGADLRITNKTAAKWLKANAETVAKWIAEQARKDAQSD